VYIIYIYIYIEREIFSPIYYYSINWGNFNWAQTLTALSYCFTAISSWDIQTAKRKIISNVPASVALSSPESCKMNLQSLWTTCGYWHMNQKLKKLIKLYRRNTPVILQMSLCPFREWKCFHAAEQKTHSFSFQVQAGQINRCFCHQKKQLFNLDNRFLITNRRRNSDISSDGTELLFYSIIKPTTKWVQISLTHTHTSTSIVSVHL